MRIWKIAAIAALGLTSFAADNVAPTKAELEDMYNTAYRAFDAGKFPEALKQLDAIDARQPDLAASKNLRGVILMRQGNYDQAEAALTEAARIDPKFWNARFNLAEIPFLKKDWAEARKRFEQLLSTGQSDLAKEASQLIQYKILLTYLMEDKSNMIHLSKRHASRIASRANQRGRHFIGNVECFDQDGLAAFQANGVFNQEFCEFIESLVVHRRLSFHHPDAIQLELVAAGKRAMR